MSMKVSVIVPVYDVEQYIEESLRAICVQNFEDYEIIVVNDGTKDNSIFVAEKILKEYNRTYSIVNKENGGLSSARNAGINAANGEYVCFIDSDDIIAPNHISDLWNCCDSNGLVASYTLFQLTYEENRYGHPKTGNLSKVIDHQVLLHDFLIRKIRIHCCSLLINRKYLLDNNILFNEKLRYGEDIDFMWRLFPTLSSLGSTENETYMYLQRTNSLMTMQNIDRVELLLGEFKKNVNSLIQKYPEDYLVLKYLYGKASLAFYRTFAEASEFKLFKELLVKTNYQKSIQSMLGIDSLKLNILGVCLLISPRVFAKIVRMNRETVGEHK